MNSIGQVQVVPKVDNAIHHINHRIVIYPLHMRAAFSSPRSQFFTIRTDPMPANNMFIFLSAVNWFYRLQMGLFTQLLSLDLLVHCILTICKKILATRE